jgi:hypothetical protein
VLTAVASRFGLGEVIACTPITEGLMNPNWRLTTTAGVFAIKQLRDAAPADGRRQQSVLPLLAARGLPVPEVMGAEVEGHHYLVARWMPGRHRLGTELSPDACRALGDLVGRIHAGLAEAMPEAEAGLAANGPETESGPAATMAGAEAGLVAAVPEAEAGPAAWVGGLPPVADRPRVAAFAEGYRRRFTIGDDALVDAAHRRWWRLATDTYFLRRHYDLGDPACDHLLRRSAEVLRWWTAHRDEFDAALRSG